MNKSLALYSIAVLFCSLDSWADSVRAQGLPSGGSGHICLEHPVTDHGTSVGYWNPVFWKRISLVDGPTVPVVPPADEEWVILVDHTEANRDCEAEKITISETREVTHSCTVTTVVSLGGSVELAGNALFLKCKLAAQANVELTGAYTDTVKEVITVETEKTLQACDIKNFEFKRQKLTSKGEIETFDHKITCQRGGATWTAYCNRVILKGSAMGWAKSSGTWSDAGKVNPCPCGEVPGGGGGGSGGQPTANGGGLVPTPAVAGGG